MVPRAVEALGGARRGRSSTQEADAIARARAHRVATRSPARRAPVGRALQPRRRVDRLHEPHPHALPRAPRDADRRHRRPARRRSQRRLAPSPGRRTARRSSSTSPRSTARSRCGRDLRVVDVATGGSARSRAGARARARRPPRRRDASCSSARTATAASSRPWPLAGGGRATSRARSRACSGAARASARTARASRPRASRPAAGSTSCSSTPRRASRGAAHRRPREGRRARLDARRHARRVPLRPRRRLEPVRAAARGPRAAARHQRAGRRVRARRRARGRRRRLRELRGARLRRARDGARRGRASSPPSRSWTLSGAPPRPAPAGGRRPPLPPVPDRAAALLEPVLRYSTTRCASGVATGGADPLLRHAYGVDAHWGSETEQPSAARASTSTTASGPPSRSAGRSSRSRRSDGSRLRTRELTLRASLPVVRRAALVAVGLAGLAAQPRGPRSARGRRSSTWAAWRRPGRSRTCKRYPLSISPVDGARLRVAYVKESPGARQRRRARQAAGGRPRVPARRSARTDVLALLAAGGTTFGRPGVPALVRGGRLSGRQPARRRAHQPRRAARLRRTAPSAAAASPRATPSTASRSGTRSGAAYSLPFFVRHLHAAVFADAGHAWSGRLPAGTT